MGKGRLQAGQAWGRPASSLSPQFPAEQVRPGVPEQKGQKRFVSVWPHAAALPTPALSISRSFPAFSDCLWRSGLEPYIQLACLCSFRPDRARISFSFLFVPMFRFSFLLYCYLLVHA